MITIITIITDRTLPAEPRGSRVQKGCINEDMKVDRVEKDRCQSENSRP